MWWPSVGRIECCHVVPVLGLMPRRATAVHGLASLRGSQCGPSRHYGRVLSKAVLSEVVGFPNAVRVALDASEGFAVVEQDATATGSFPSVEVAGGRLDPLVSLVLACRSRMAPVPVARPCSACPSRNFGLTP